MDSDTPSKSTSHPTTIAYVAGFLAVGICWGLTTPFIRKAAVNYTPPSHPSITDPSRSWIARKFSLILWTVLGLLRSPTYAVPLLMNLTGSLWFFLLVGQAELSLTIPITNSLAFLFTVLGEWWAEGKVISRDTWIGMAFVLGGIGLCVSSKTGSG